MNKNIIISFVAGISVTIVALLVWQFFSLRTIVTNIERQTVANTEDIRAIVGFINQNTVPSSQATSTQSK